MKLSENEIKQIEAVKNDPILLVVGISKNEGDDQGFFKCEILIYKELKGTLKPVHKIDNYDFSTFKIYKAIGDSYTIIMNEGEDFYQYNLAEICESGTQDKSVDSDVNSMVLDGRFSKNCR